MKFKDLPIKDKDILEGRKPLPEEATYLMDKYIGTEKYINPDVDYPKLGRSRRAEVQETDLYSPMKQNELEALKWGRELTEAFNVNPKTLEMTPKEGQSKEASKRYFDLIKKNLEIYSPTDNKISNRIRGALSDGQDKNLSSQGLVYKPDTGDLIKRNESTFVLPQSSRKETASLRNIIEPEDAVAEYQQVSPYANLLQAVKEKYKNVPDSEKRLELENFTLMEAVNKNPALKADMEILKKYQQEVIDLYKQHSKKFGGSI